jgi:hypothetical protein
VVQFAMKDVIARKGAKFIGILLVEFPVICGNFSEIKFRAE